MPSDDEMMNMFAALNASEGDSSHDRRVEDYLHCGMNYVGNKYQQLGWLLPKLPYHETYTEVFGGGGAVLIGKKRKPLEVFNDRYSGSVALYKCIQDSDLFDELVGLIASFPHSREFWRWCLDTYQGNTGTEAERAARFYYLVQCSFGGKHDAFARVTTGRNSVPEKIRKHLPNFPLIHERLQNVLIENKDYYQVMLDFDSPVTLHYLDPPYYDNERYGTGFDRAEHVKMLERIFQMEGAVALSGQDNDLYDKFPWDDVHINHDVDNRINSVTSDRTTRKEILWIKEAS